MIRLQRISPMPDNNRLGIIASILINWLHKYNLTEYDRIKELREILKSEPAKALKQVANLIVAIIEQRKGI